MSHELEGEAECEHCHVDLIRRYHVTDCENEVVYRHHTPIPGRVVDLPSSHNGNHYVIKLNTGHYAVIHMHRIYPYEYAVGQSGSYRYVVGPGWGDYLFYPDQL